MFLDAQQQNTLQKVQLDSNHVTLKMFLCAAWKASRRGRGWGAVKGNRFLRLLTLVLLLLTSDL